MSFHVAITPPLFIKKAPDLLRPEQGQSNWRFKIEVYPDWYRTIRLSWEVPSEWGEVVFNVYASQHELGPFQKLNPTPLVGTFFSDTATEEYGKFANGFYKVEAILLDRGKARLYSEPTTWRPYQRRWVTLRASEIQRRENWLLTKFAGIKTYYFRKKRYGKRCPLCWDKRTETVQDDRCPVCLGTSFVGGYFDPAIVYFQYETTPNSREFQYFGTFEPNQIGVWTLSFPELSPEDIIIRDGDWNLYEIVQVMSTELQGNKVRQMASVSQLAKKDVEYQLMQRVPKADPWCPPEVRPCRRFIPAEKLEIDLRGDGD